ncbi:MAG: hypothetical protein H3C43_03350, partial [Leptonema sp. (in: Bacteria)]|nr:hypothetical protein [Leptonema sp. (in: bacteria)]
MAGIQNIDFSQKIPTTSNSKSANKGSIDLSRLFGWGVAISVLVFTAGLLAGLKIAELRSFEKTLVKYPAQNGFSNTTETTNQTKRSEVQNSQAEKSKPTASLIIRIGSFSASRAGELARSLN